MPHTIATNAGLCNVQIVLPPNNCGHKLAPRGGCRAEDADTLCGNATLRENTTREVQVMTIKATTTYRHVFVRAYECAGRAPLAYIALAMARPKTKH